jgi:hypothetical protein
MKQGEHHVLPHSSLYSTSLVSQNRTKVIDILIDEKNQRWRKRFQLTLSHPCHLRKLQPVTMEKKALWPPNRLLPHFLPRSQCIYLLYSPTQNEIDTHPIRQRLSVSRDHIDNQLRSSLEAEHTTTTVEGTAPATAIANLRLEAQHSQKDALSAEMSDNNSVEKGDEGMTALFAARRALP